MVNEYQEEDDHARRIGYLVIEKAKSLGWPTDPEEGELEFWTRRAYETGYEDAQKAFTAEEV